MSKVSDNVLCSMIYYEVQLWTETHSIITSGQSGEEDSVALSLLPLGRIKIVRYLYYSTRQVVPFCFAV